MKQTFQKFEKSIFGFPKRIKNLIASFIEECKVAKIKLKNFTQTNYNLGLFHINHGNMVDAKFRFFLVTKLEPNFASAHYHLARCHLFNLDFNKAKKELEIVLSLDKTYKAAEYRLKLINKSIKNDTIPLQVIEEDYDNLADKYEDFIDAQYKHNIHEILAKLIAPYMKNIQDSFALDLGCGTGLLGAYLRQVVAIKSLFGVDISTRMLNLAKNLTTEDHPVYNCTKVLDFNNLKSLDDKYDVITACMSLGYTEDLESAFESIDKIKAKRTILGIIVLKSSKSDIDFDYKNGCYSFSVDYLNKIFDKFNWTILEQKDIKLFSNGLHCLAFVLKNK